MRTSRADRCAQWLAGVAFDERRGTIPNEDGRVLDGDGAVHAGVYTSGWIRRGAQGGLGSSRLDASEIVDHIVTDFNGRQLADPMSAETPTSTAVDLAGWASIDAHEREAGRGAGRPRVKLTSTAEMLAVAVGSRD